MSVARGCLQVRAVGASVRAATRYSGALCRPPQNTLRRRWLPATTATSATAPAALGCRWFTRQTPDVSAPAATAVAEAQAQAEAEAEEDNDPRHHHHHHQDLGVAGGGFPHVDQDHVRASTQPATQPPTQPSDTTAAKENTDSDATMDDEYGAMQAEGEQHVFLSHQLESGRELTMVPVQYKTFGQLNAAGDNGLVVCHALTGNASLDSWWGPLLGPGKLFDTDKYFVVCANILGSCYGTCGPRTIDVTTGKPYSGDFPIVTVRDTVALHARLVKEVLGVTRVVSVIGGSLGGMQAIEWALMEPELVQSVVPIACGAAHSAWQIAVSEPQRQAIYADPNWKGGFYDPSQPPASGLAVARQMAMVTYRTFGAYQQRFGRQRQTDQDTFKVESYLHHQGRKFVKRFDAVSYVRLTQQLDSHDVGRGRGGVEAALSKLKARALVVGVDSDVLYPVEEQQLLHRLTGASEQDFVVLKSDNGHDGFLLEPEQLSAAVSSFFQRHGITPSAVYSHDQQSRL
eukprot:m.312439 g.312439  ORF g.312439 m.312439 type:complete len:515 (+) comp19658_c4_seq4:456-2000(+)